MAASQRYAGNHQPYRQEMIVLNDRKDCSGCAACASICSHGCISMESDAEGFAYAKVDAAKCVGCGLCDRVCPMISIPGGNSVAQVVAAKNRDLQQRLRSSSGGVFRLLAERVIEEGGVVVGCRLNDKMEAEHKVACEVSELDALMSSKYVQSDTSGIYETVRRMLREGRLVLFSGVPCQVAALRNFLMKPYDNLITVDVLCHGVPSPKVFAEYIERLEQRYGEKALSASFRCKDKSWKRLYINVLFDNGKRHFMYAGYDSYMQLFLSDRLQRPSCFECPYNTLDRPGDISLGDFWGIGKKDYDFDDNKGVSMVLVNNERGGKLWSKVASKTIGFTSDIETAVAGNKVLVKHLPSCIKRDEFYKCYVENGFDAAVRKFSPEPPKGYRLYRDFLRRGLDIVRRIRKQGY